MSPQEVIEQLQANQSVFASLFAAISTDMAVWKPAPKHWCLLEIVCHLCDEEREDFGARLKSVLDDPAQPLAKIDPQDWVVSRNYLGQDFDTKVAEFLKARDTSVAWLHALEDPPWQNAYDHERMGPLSARFFLENWLAHDYLHIRQINRRKYEYACAHASGTLGYAGEW